jgi:quinoprotein glucose dehydrogenase
MLTRYRPRTPLAWLVALVIAGILGLGLAYALESSTRLVSRFGAGPGRIFGIFVEASNREGPVSAVQYFIYTARSRDSVPAARPKSWFDPEPYWRPESAEARAALPEFKTLPALKPESYGKSLGVAPGDLGLWRYPHGDAYASKYSPLTQINPQTLGKLAVAWRYEPDDRGDSVVVRNSRGVLVGGNVGHSPVFGDGRLYFATPGRRIVAVDARTGKQVWSVTPGGVTPARRGVTFWPGDAKNPARVFFPAGWRLMALDARTGKPVRRFAGGAVKGLESKLPPMIDGNRIIVVTTTPGLEAFDVVTGKRLWKRDLQPKAEPIYPGGPLNDLNGGASWSGTSLDPQRHLIFVPTGNPGPPLHGAGRPGDNKPTSSIVAIDTRTGETRWLFQDVAHDLWDYDVPSPPTLTTITHAGKRVDVVAVVSKLGHLILLDRDQGRPIMDYRMRRAPVSTTPGEKTAAYQPDLQTPQPFSKKVFTLEDVTNVSPANRAGVMADLRTARFGFFEPPVLGQRLVTFGVHGGGEWPGVSINPDTGMMYFTANQVPHSIYIYFKSSKGEAKGDWKGRDLYRQKCASCHGDARQGYFEPEEKGGAYTPPLMGISIYRSPQALRNLAALKQRHGAVKTDLSGAELDQVATYFEQADRSLDADKALSVGFMWNRFVDREGYPASKPPWGLVSAMNLSTGKIQWSRPFGTYESLTKRGLPPTGQANFGGLMSTKSGLIFATGTLDRKLRVFAADSGAELWVYDLPSMGSSPPMTYEIDGVQYVAVMATGGVLQPFDKRTDRDALVVFRLAK